MASHGRNYMLQDTRGSRVEYKHINEMRVGMSGCLAIIDVNGHTLRTYGPHAWAFYEEVAGIPKGYGG